MCGSRQAPSTTGTARPLLLVFQSTPALPAKHKKDMRGLKKCKIQPKSSMGIGQNTNSAIPKAKGSPTKAGTTILPFPA